MTSNSETGHSINIGNFKKLHDVVRGFGGTWNPSNTDLTVPSLFSKWTAADMAHTALNAALQRVREPLNERKILFKGLDPLVTRTLNNFYSTKASDEAKKDAKGIGDRIRGTKAKDLTTPTEGIPNASSISTSHRSYVQKADGFHQLIEFYRNQPLYAPNEDALNLEALDALYGQMRTMNDGVGALLEPVEQVRLTRDRELYAQDTGIVDLSVAAKKYATGLFGANKAETRMLTGLKFTRVKRDRQTEI